MTFHLVTMPWKCLDCSAVFDGPTDRCPDAGCPQCGSSTVIDLSVETVPEEELSALLPSGGLCLPCEGRGYGILWFEGEATTATCFECQGTGRVNEKGQR